MWWDGLLLMNVFFSSFLSYLLENHASHFKFQSFLLVIDISTLILILLISNFFSWSVCKSFICFQFYFSILICDILFFSNLVFIILISIFSLILLWNFYLFSILPFNPDLWYVIFFRFGSHSFIFLSFY